MILIRIFHEPNFKWFFHRRHVTHVHIHVYVITHIDIRTRTEQVLQFLASFSPPPCWLFSSFRFISPLIFSFSTSLYIFPSLVFLFSCHVLFPVTFRDRGSSSLACPLMSDQLAIHRWRAPAGRESGWRWLGRSHLKRTWARSAGE